MPPAPGERATFEFLNLTPQTTYSVSLTSGATFSGTVFSCDPAFENVVAAGETLRFTTTSQGVKGTIAAGLVISQQTFSGTSSLSGVEVLVLDCRTHVTTQGGAFNLDTGVGIPPTCVLCGAGPEYDCPPGMNLYLDNHNLFCCVVCPDDCA